MNINKDINYWVNLINENQDTINEAVKKNTNDRCKTCMYAKKEASRIEVGETLIKIEGFCIDEKGNKNDPIMNLKEGYCLRYKRLPKLNN